MIFCVDGLHLRVGPAHHFNWFDVFADVAASNFHTMTAEVEDSTAPCLVDIPEPVAVRTRVCLAGFSPKDSSKSTVLHAFMSFDMLRSINKVFEVASKYSSFLNSL